MSYSGLAPRAFLSLWGICATFLTLSNVKLWFDAEEIRERLEDRIEYLKSQEEDKTEGKNGEEVISGW